MGTTTSSASLVSLAKSLCCRTVLDSLPVCPVYWPTAELPFKVGVWEGPDGRGVVAAFDPGDYVGKVQDDLSRNDGWLARIDNTGKQSGAFVDYHYYGTGDRGGAPDEDSVRWIERSVAGHGPLRVISSSADRMFKELKHEQIAKLPRYKGELLLTEHSAGSITSEAYMKRWNRKNELLADAAERASVAAMWLRSAPYPSKKLYDAWDLVLGSQMHDMLPGTSLPKAYEFCWNDEILAQNQFSVVLEDALGAVVSSLDTRTKGVPIIVYNPLSIQREDVVEASIAFPGVLPKNIQVFDPRGRKVPSQILGRDGGKLKILFLGRAPSVGFSAYDVRPVDDASQLSSSPLKITEDLLENQRYLVRVNGSGDVASIFDKSNNRELLSAPLQLAFQYEKPAEYPAWNMDWEDQKNPPRGYVNGPARIRVVESGPVRVALEVSREAEGSTFVQTIRSVWPILWQPTIHRWVHFNGVTTIRKSMRFRSTSGST